jgi:dihydrofolate reductase
VKDEVGFADKFNTMPKYVVSSTLTDPEWTNSTVISIDEVATIKDQLGGELVVHGSGQLVQALLERDLVDELRLMVYPFVLGDGERLFGDTPDKLQLKLASTQTVGDGVVILTYTKA